MALRRHRSMQKCLVSAALLLAASSTALAQTVTVKEAYTRKLGFRTSDKEPNWISYSDCTGDDELYFETTLVKAVGYSLEVWVGSSADCTAYEARLGSSPTCWQVFKTSAQLETQKVTIRAQDVIAQNKSTDGTWGQGSGTLADCDDSGAPSDGQAVTFYFLLVDGTGQPVTVGAPATRQTTYDLVGPPAPGNVSAGIGEDLLVVSWSASTASDLIGYRVYCDPKPGAQAPANSPMADAGLAGATATDAATDAASGGTSGDAAADATSDAAGSGGASGSGGSGGGGGNPNCPSAALVPGERPDSAYQCGSVTSKTDTSTEAKGLLNGVNYAVAVAGFDRVGNSGPLSSVACGSPQPVDDFFELYRRAGGKGGGGFCAIGADPSPASLALAGLALGAWLVRRRRRQG
ncbi:MAG: hypothetical protein HS104_00210 [Polyangiaceae bacterium]|nr:hypothetical protein [Polyangiaceae bacterium]MCL4752833.1 hypothetical protein [Myxococcales bacterium]